MNDEEINAEMKKYTDALEKLKYEAWDEGCKKCDEIAAGDMDKYDEIYNETVQKYFEQAKEKCHNIAMECLNKILTPELKVFIKNLCLDRLNYPDDPVFYKLFGDYPQIGDRVSSDEVKAEGFGDLCDMNDICFHENSCWLIEKDIDGKIWWEIERLYEPSEEEILENRKRMRAFSNAKRFIAKSDKLSEKDKEEMFNLLNKIVPSHTLKF